MLDCFERYRVPATFFVETQHRTLLKEDPMRSIAQLIAAAGHGLQLHVHPCWSVFAHHDWRERVRHQPRR